MAKLRAVRKKTEPEAGVSEPATPEPEIQPEPVIPASVRSTVSQNRKPRIIVRLDDSGSVDFNRMEPDERTALQNAFRSQMPIEKTDPALVCMVLAGIGSLEASILATRFDLDPDECRRIIGPHEPLAGLLGQAGAKVIDKHNLVGRWGDEIALFALLASWQSATFQQIRALKASKHETRSDLGKAASGEINPGVSAGVRQ